MCEEMIKNPYRRVWACVNLDALHDELASETENLRITLVYPNAPKGKMAEYLPNLLRVFEDTARENYHLEITLQEGRSEP